MRDTPRKLTLCTYRSATSSRKVCGRWREVTAGGRGEALPWQPALHPQPSQDDQVTGIGAVAPPGAGPATGAGGRDLGQGPLAFGVGRG